MSSTDPEKQIYLNEKHSSSTIKYYMNANFQYLVVMNVFFLGKESSLNMKHKSSISLMNNIYFSAKYLKIIMKNQHTNFKLLLYSV